ncbi:ubiquitin-conjugating enzyme/RWD-like protein [Lipomyces arxii]|uniref:ubiquitin-conjugating enzyme/RWD-like protein n=1 Tax=Lipomyces arxii TaxID=56418 RepID=UPI0034CE6EE8
MATRAATKRLTREYKNIEESPPPYIVAHPSEKDILKWHYLITGPPGTPYEGGQYHGTLTFPDEYPYKPPAIRMVTPSGRFQTNTRLCLSFSDYHPKTWNPAWSVSTILTGLLSFMTSDEVTTGALRSTDREKVKLAKLSHEWNLRQNRKFVEEFPTEAEENERLILEWRRVRQGANVSNFLNTGTGSVVAGAGGNGAANGIGGGPVGAFPGENGHLGVLDTSAIGTKNPTVGQNGPGGQNGSWIVTHKAVCAGILVFAYVLASRIMNSTS